MNLFLNLKRSEKNPYTIRLCWKVCGTCNGKGTHVNPSIDAHGLSNEDLDEDPYFREQYTSGMYDETCFECGGRTTVLEISEHSKKADLKATEKFLSDIDTDRREQINEEKYGY